jgi:hypothetical protein
MATRAVFLVYLFELSSNISQLLYVQIGNIDLLRLLLLLGHCAVDV